MTAAALLGFLLAAFLSGCAVGFGLGVMLCQSALKELRQLREGKPW